MLDNALTENESTTLKEACPEGIYLSLTPGDPTKWSGVLFVREGRPLSSTTLNWTVI